MRPSAFADVLRLGASSLGRLSRASDSAVSATSVSRHGAAHTDGIETLTFRGSTTDREVASQSRRTCFVAAVVVSLAAATGSPAQAADLLWTYGSGCSGADFSSTCWSDAVQGTSGHPAPTSGDRVFLWQSDDVTLPVNFANASSPTFPRLHGLDIRGFGLGFAALKLERNVLDTTFDFGGTSIAAESGRGRIDQSGGTHRTTSLHIGPYGAHSGSGAGLYNLSGGSLEVVGNTLPLGTIVLAGSDRGTGTFSQSGGSVSALGLYVGHDGNDSGGLGTYTLSGGTLTVDTVVSGALGTFNFDGGTFELTGQTASFNTFSIGNAAASNAAFTQKAGQSITVRELELGAGVGGTGTYTLSGGTLQVGSITNGAGTGVFNVDGGSLSFETSIDVDTFNIAINNLSGVTVSGNRSLTAATMRIGLLNNGSLRIEQGGRSPPAPCPRAPMSCSAGPAARSPSPGRAPGSRWVAA